MSEKVTDAALLAELNGPQPVSDPAVLALLNDAPQNTPAPKAATAEPTFGQRVEGSYPGRIFRGLSDALGGGIQGIQHLVTQLPGSDTTERDWFDSRLKASEEKYQNSRKAVGSTGFDSGRLVGNIINPINYVAPELRGLGIAGRMMMGATQGGALGVLQPVFDTSEESYGRQKAVQTGLGVLGGAAAPAIGATVGRGITPKVSDHARTMLDNGVRLTPGQIAGNWLKPLEDKISSIPVVGSFVGGARARATDDFNRAVLKRPLSFIGQDLPKYVKTGREGVDYVATKIGEVYDTTLPTMTGKANQPFINDLAQVVARAKNNGASTDVLARLKNVMDGQLLDKVSPNATYDGATLKTIQSELSRLAGDHMSSPSMDDQVLGDAIAAMHKAFNKMLQRENPAQAPILKKADRAWANYARVRRAASGVGAKDGKFSGPQLANAVRALDKSAGKGAYAKGKALMQDLSDAGLATLPASYPDSGTAGRLMMGALLSGGHLLGGAAAPVTAPLVALGSGLSALYTRPGQALARGVMAHKGAPALSAVAKDLGNLSVGPLSVLASEQAVDRGQ